MRRVWEGERMTALGPDLPRAASDLRQKRSGARVMAKFDVDVLGFPYSHYNNSCITLPSVVLLPRNALWGWRCVVIFSLDFPSFRQVQPASSRQAVTTRFVTVQIFGCKTISLARPAMQQVAPVFRSLGEMPIKSKSSSLNS